MTFESYECGCNDGYFDISKNGTVCEACCEEIDFYRYQSFSRRCTLRHDFNALFQNNFYYISAQLAHIEAHAKSNDSTTVEGGKFVYDCSDANDSKLNGERLEFGREDFPGHLALTF